MIKRIFLFLSLSLLLLAGGGFAAVKIFINTDHIRQQAEDTLSGIGSTKATIKGGVELTLFPQPLLTFKDIYFDNIDGAASQNIIDIREARAHIAWSHVFSRTPSFRDLTLISPLIELELLEDGKKNWHALQTVNNVSPQIGEGFIPNEITIQDGRIVYRVLNDKTDISQINLTVSMDSWHGPFDAKGSFSFQNEIIEVTGNIGDFSAPATANLRLSSPSFEANMEGKTEGNNRLDMSGILKMNIHNLGLFTGGIFPVSSLPTHITSPEKLNIEGAFDWQENQFNLRQVTFDSESIKAKAEIKAAFSPSVLWDIQSHITLLDVDKLTAKTDENISILTSPNVLNFNIPRETSLLFYVTAEKIFYRKDGILNTTFDAAMANQEFVIHTLEGIVPGKSDFEFTGAISHNGIRPLLEGDIELNGTNFNALMVWLFPRMDFVPKEELSRFVFNSKLSMMPTRIRASAIKGNIDDIGINGEFEIRPEERLPSYRFNLNIDRANLSALKIPDKIVSSFEELKKDIKDPFANSFISKLHGKYSFLLHGNNLMLNGNKLTESVMDLTLSANRIELKELSVKTSESDATLTYFSNLASNPPTIDATVSARALNLDVFFPPSEEETRWTWGQDRFNFLGLQEYRGSFKAKAGYLRYDRLRLQQLEIDSALKDGVISLARAQANIGGGPFIVKGQIGIGDANSFGISYGINGAEIADILATFTDDVDVKGKLYASGKATAFGGTPLGLINNLTGDMKLSAKNVLVNHLGLTNLIQKAPLLKSAIDLDELKQQSLQNGTTLFNAVGGNIEFKNGLASTQDLKASTRYSRGLIAANFDLKSFLIKAVSKHRFAINNKQTLSVGLDLEGPFIAPTKSMDVSQIEKFITDRAKRR